MVQHLLFLNRAYAVGRNHLTYYSTRLEDKQPRGAECLLDTKTR
jgi:hypothetical protein